MSHVKSLEKNHELVEKVHEIGNIGWKVHELTQNLHEIELALLWSHLTKGECYFGSHDSRQHPKLVHTLHPHIMPCQVTNPMRILSDSPF